MLPESDKERDTVAGYLERWPAAHEPTVQPSTHRRYG